MGFVNQSELPAVYASADVLVLPSDGQETWGLVVNEAMACGVPAVVSDAVGCGPDLIEPGRTGATFPFGDIAALAAAIEERPVVRPPSRRAATLPPRWRCTRLRRQQEPSSTRRLLLLPMVSYNDRASRRTRDSQRHLTMNSRHMPLAVRAAPAPAVLDLNCLKRVFFYIAVALMFFAPFSQDPMAFAVGAAVPWLILQIIARPGMPVAVVYLLIWQWLQIFARLLQSMVDGESLASGLYGPNVARAYWYMLASLVVHGAGLAHGAGQPQAADGPGPQGALRMATARSVRTLRRHAVPGCRLAGMRPPSCRLSTSPSMPYRA